MKSIAPCQRCVFRACVSLAVLFLFIFPAAAHDPGLSTATVTVNREHIDVLLGFARQDVAALLPDNANAVDLATPEGFQAARSGLEDIATSGLKLYLGDERLLPIQTTAQLKDSRNVEILISFRRTNVPQLRLESTFLERLPLGHREFLSVQTAAGASLGEAMLSAKKSAFQVQLPVTSTGPLRHSDSFWEFLKLGVEHILTGDDHLLFLFGLMVVCQNLRSILTV